MLNQIAEIVAFLIIVWVLWKYLLPMIKNMISGRQEVVQKQVDDSAEAERLVREKLSDESSRSESVDAFLAQLGDLTQRGAGAGAKAESTTSGGGA